MVMLIICLLFPRLIKPQVMWNQERSQHSYGEGGLDMLFGMNSSLEWDLTSQLSTITQETEEQRNISLQQTKDILGSSYNDSK